MRRHQETSPRFLFAGRSWSTVALTFGFFGVTTVVSCSHDWNSYDPRLGNSSSSTNSSSASSGSSGMGGQASSSSSGIAGEGGMAGGGGASAGGMGGIGGMGGLGGAAGAGGGVTCVPDTGKACYSGPAGTENVGQCKGGATLCQQDGMSYGPCLGEVIPVVEECSTTTIDDDCNGAANDHCGIWATRLSGTLEQSALSIATDAMDNVYVTGHLQGVAD